MKEKWSDHLLEHKALFQENTIVGLFGLAVEHEPEKEALVAEPARCAFNEPARCTANEPVRLTYSELDRQSDQIAWALLEEGVEVGEVVALRTGQSACSVAAILGIWKIGCAYVFLDSDQPAFYNTLCVQECGVRHQVTEEFLERVLGRPLPGAPQRQTKGAFAERGDMDRLAVVVYTSGSTGKPKGVLITQRNLAASISNFGEIGFTSNDHYGCFASLMFIASVYDIALSLSIGATLYLIPKAIRKNIREVAEYYKEKTITATFLPPHMAMKYMELDQESPLRLLLSGSEPVRNLNERPYTIVNVYASSEACAVASFYKVADSRRSYPIGQLVSALRGYIVDEAGEPVQAGEVGELWISGPQVSKGYCRMQELTAERFCPNPFCRDAFFETVFKTGDMVAKNEMGELVYHGRRDNMVKIRGFRVELTGVEKHMLEYPKIKEACCKAYADKGGTNLLFGYYISEGPIDHEDLRRYLGTVMPYYMIPLGLVRCEKFPRTLSGKVDRQAFLPPNGLDDWRGLAERYR